MHACNALSDHVHVFILMPTCIGCYLEVTHGLMFDLQVDVSVLMNVELHADHSYSCTHVHKL